MPTQVFQSLLIRHGTGYSRILAEEEFAAWFQEIEDVLEEDFEFCFSVDVVDDGMSQSEVEKAMV